MKKIITLIILVAVVVGIIIIAGRDKVEGVWTCSYYAIYNSNYDNWLEQGEEVRGMFLLKIYDNGKIVVRASGNDNEGVYTVNKDTLNVTIKDLESQYLIEKDKLTLIKHPRAKIEYTRIAKIEGE